MVTTLALQLSSCLVACDQVQSALNLFANGADVQKHGDKQRGGFILPEVTMVEIGAEIY